MDEVLFHLSQSLDAIRVWLYTQSQLGLQLLGETKEWALAVCNSPQIVQWKNTSEQLWLHLISVLQHLFNPQSVLARLSTLLGNNGNRATLYAGCVGFTVGGSVGLLIGFCMQPTPHVLTTMKAVATTSFCGIDSVSFLDDAIAPLLTEPDEVLIQVKAASLDPVDIRISCGFARALRNQLNRYKQNGICELPVVLGRDCCGIVIELGQSVKRFEVGDEVWLARPAWETGTLAQFVVAKEWIVGKKPRTLGFEGAASLPYCGAIAWDAVMRRAKLGLKNTQYKRVLVHCGSSGVGCVITQLCRMLGISVTVTCLHRAVPVMGALGANQVFPLEIPDLEKQLARKERFDVVFNTAGPVAHQFCLCLCSPEGIVVTTVADQFASDSYGFLLGTLYSLWIRLTHGLLGLNLRGGASFSARVLDELASLVDSGQLQPVVDRIFQPHAADLAFHHINSAHAIGKTIISFSASPGVTPIDRPDIII